MILETKKEVVNLQGKPLKYKNEGDEKEEVLTVGEAIANILLADKTGGKMKMFVLADKIYKAEGNIDIDKADFSLIKTAVEKTESYGNLINGQVLLLLEETKEDGKKSD